MPSTDRPARVSAIPSLRLAAGTALGVAIADPALAQAPAAAGPAVQLPTLSVEGSEATGYRVGTPSLPRLTEPLLDTPQSVTVVPRALIEEQEATALRDALRNVPGISLAAGEGGAQGDNLTLRGFNARNDFFLDGMRDFGSYTRDTFNLEAVEVLKGPASVLFGRGSTGGVINQVSKQARLAPVTAGSVSLGTGQFGRLAVDMGRPIDGLDGAAIRLNAMAQSNEVMGRDVAQYNRFGIAPALAFGLGTATRLTVNYLHQQEYDTPDYGIPWLYAGPADVPRQTFYGFDGSDYLRTRVDSGTIRVEHDINDNLTLRTQFRYADYTRATRVTAPQVVYTGITSATPLANIAVNRNMVQVNSGETFMQDQTDVLARFRTGPVEHVLIAGFELGRETSDPDRTSWTGVPRANLLYPNSAQPFTGTARLTSQQRTTSDTAALYAMDTLKFAEQWELMGGLRWDNFNTTSRQQVAPVARYSQTDSLVSWRAALVFKPLPNGSVYVSAGTSFNPSAEGLTITASNADLSPEKNESYEIGTKWDVNDGRLTLTGAIFQIEKTNARVPDPNNTGFNILGGKQRVRGFEIGAAGRLTEAWQVFGGYAFMQSKVLTTTQAGTAGNELANAPQNTLSLWSTYRLPWRGVQLGGGVQYVSSRLASSTRNTTTGLLATAPGYVNLQAMVKVPVRPGIDLQLNAFNLADVKFYDQVYPGHVVPGSGRTIVLTTSFSL